MSLDEVVTNNELKDLFEWKDPSEVTVEDLVDMYGVEAVKRGMEYTASLSDAQKAFVDSVDGNKAEYSREFAESYTGEKARNKEVEDKWANASKEKGLGLVDD